MQAALEVATYSAGMFVAGLCCVMAVLFVLMGQWEDKARYPLIAIGLFALALWLGGHMTELIVAMR